MSWKLTRVFFVRTYDDLFKLVLANLYWLLLSLPVVTWPAATLALYEFVNQLLRYQDPDYKVLWRGMRKWFWRSFPVFGVLVLSFLVPLYGMYFYLNTARSLGVVSYILFGLSFWITLFCVLCQIYFIPLLVHQGISILKAMKRSALLVLLRPGLSLMGLSLWLLLAVFLVILPFLFLLFLYGSAVAMLKTAGLLVALEEYED